MKKLLALIICSYFLSHSVYANDYTQNTIPKNSAQNLCSVEECEAELFKDYKSNKLKTNLINAYLQRAKKYGDTGNYNAAANDYRAALFYFLYWDSNTINNENIEKSIEYITHNLTYCFKKLNFEASPKNRYNTAIYLYDTNKYAAAGYEFNQSGEYSKKAALNYLLYIMQKLGNSNMSMAYYTKIKEERALKPNIYENADSANLTPYMNRLNNKIKSNWNPKIDTVSKETILRFTIDKEGNITKYNVYKSSGNKKADEKAIEALQKSCPFEPLPKEFKGTNINVQFTFDYDVYPNYQNKR